MSRNGRPKVGEVVWLTAPVRSRLGRCLVLPDRPLILERHTTQERAVVSTPDGSDCFTVYLSQLERVVLPATQEELPP